jgi:tetratricopeptide (TPR) repeat protein
MSSTFAMKNLKRFFLCVLCVLCVESLLTAAQPPSAVAADAQFQEARRLFDALDYEKAVGALDLAIAALEASTPRDLVRRDKLASAYEMRARSKFGLGDQDGTKADFILLLKLDPGHTLSGVSPRVVALFEETMKDMVTNLTLSVTPATATVEIDGVPVVAPGTIRVGVGEHVVSAEQAGYRGSKQTVVAAAGATAEVALALERVSSVLKIVTVPADVDVKVDGKSVGKTVADGGVAPADAARPGAASTRPSAPLIVSDVATGPHVVELSRECYAKVSNRVAVEKPDDYPLGPITLQPALATLTVKANQNGAQVFIDGKDRGVVPFMMADLCEGDHLVELRTKFGRDAKRVTARAGGELTIDGVLKPAFVIVSSSAPANIPQDMRVLVERAFAPSQTVALMAPPLDQTEAALKANQLLPDWLATDAEGRPAGASAQMAGPLRKDVSEKLAQTFGAQGVASVTALGPSRVVLALLAAGSSSPDVVDVALDSQQSIGAAIAKLDRVVPLSKPAIGIVAIDVADVAGAVVVGVDTSGGTPPTVKAGDVIVQADGQPVADALSLEKIVAAHKAGDTIALDVKDAAAAARKADVKVFLTPRLIGLSEQGLLVNRILLDLRARAADGGDPFEQAVIRLNTAVALARIGDWNAAKAELAQLKLPDRPGVGNGTIQYLIGVCADALGNRAEAETAFKAAAATDSLLTEDGPSVKELAEAKLAEIQRAAPR